MDKHKCCCYNNDDFPYDYDWQKTNLYSKYYDSNNTEYILNIEVGKTKEIELEIKLESSRIEDLYLSTENNERFNFELVSDNSEEKTSLWKVDVSFDTIGSQLYDVILKLKSGVKVLLYQGIINSTGVIETENITYSHILSNNESFDGFLNVVTTSQNQITSIQDLVNLIKNNLVINIYYVLDNTTRVVNRIDCDDEIEIMTIGDFFDISSMVYLDLEYSIELIDQTIIL